jgi:hypothetical protein
MRSRHWAVRYAGLGIRRVATGRERCPEISRGKFRRLPRTTAGFTSSALDGYGLRDSLPARPTLSASNPVLVHRLVLLLRASFRPRLAATPLRFAIASPPSGCEEDLHLQAEHPLHTIKEARLGKTGLLGCERAESCKTPDDGTLNRNLRRLSNEF